MDIIFQFCLPTHSEIAYLPITLIALIDDHIVLDSLYKFTVAYDV